MSGDRDVPIGRRVARLRARLGMTQQVFASRIGKSKSWVDKVERGLRTLDRLSVIESVAEVLGVTLEVLLAKEVQREPQTGGTGAVDRVRAALACHHTAGAGQPVSVSPVPLVPPDVLDRQVGNAWEAYRHARHPQVVRMLPELLGAAWHAGAAAGPGSAEGPLPRVYRLAAQVLIKLGEPELAWLAADRAMATAAGDPRHTGLAAITLAQALRALGQGRLAMAAAIVAAHDLTPAPSRDAPPGDLALAGTLLTEAALAAATWGDEASVHELIEHAARLAHAHGERPRHGSSDVGFGPVMVDLARALAAIDLGDSQRAITTHLYATSGHAWRWLDAEHRAAHLIDIARAHLDVGDPGAAGRALVAADRIAPAETRTRPAARAALTAVLRTGPTAADVTQFATAIGLAPAS